MMSVIDYKKIKTNIVAFDFFDTIVHRDCNPEIILFKWAKEVSCYLRFSISSSVIYQIRKKIETGNGQASCPRCKFCGQALDWSDEQ